MSDAVDAGEEHVFEVSREDWATTHAEWLAATELALTAGKALDWSALTTRAVDDWLAASERADIARRRLGAVCEAGLQKK